MNHEYLLLAQVWATLAQASATQAAYYARSSTHNDYARRADYYHDKARDALAQAGAQ